jgi:hypothetical protein
LWHRVRSPGARAGAHRRGHHAESPWEDPYLDLRVAGAAHVPVELEARGCVEAETHVRRVEYLHALGADVASPFGEVEQTETRERPGVGDPASV